jgi:tetratricopeptide (TPR) repeat protein
MRQFQAKKGSRYSLISMLSSIGDQSVVDMLIAEYPKLDNNEKRSVLQGMQQMHSPEYVRLASEALLINDSSLLNTAADGLYKDGSPLAEKALIDALKHDAKHNYWSYICNALVNFATPDARLALREARNTKHENKKTSAINALRSLQQRSPGNQYIYQAKNYVKQLKWDLAIRYYGLSIEADSEYAEAYAGRGNAYLNSNKPKEALADFERAIKADPESSQGHTGIAIMKILDGKIEEGIKYAETSRKEIEPFESNKAMTLYNSACVYGRAVEKLAAAPSNEDRDKKLQDYQAKAVKELEEAVKNHFSDFDMMQNDPDLKSLSKLPDFQKLLPDANKAANKKRPNLGIKDEAVKEAAF